ncbi:MAG: PhnD/SsuA/transferrin family substrate-binding protein [Pseudomonadales bacterium]|nr:PhnD/SsuA/transferrin family substrate-binding protein [Pseudomonadales bacterium]
MVLPRAELRRQGIAFKPRFVASHDSVYRNVAQGLYPAGGGIARTLALVDGPVRERLRVLWSTPDFTAHAIASHPRHEEAMRKRLMEAMVAMNGDAQGLKLLARIGFNRFEAASDQDWADIRRLGIQPGDSQIQE